MRFLSIYKTAESGIPPTPEYMETMGRLVEEARKGGRLLATEGCLPSALGARVRSSGGAMFVTDGPFVETKEIIAGFAVLEAPSKEEAIRMTKDFLKVAGDGECELRQIFTPSEGAGDCSAAQRELAEQFARQ
ncbi:MAG TPA: YciI family protein [Vicinamibacterales bacterium]|nr:YciI family protein [Vicinamibacterales bacterium]